MKLFSFVRPTVNSIIKDIVQKVEQLHAVSEAHHAAADIHDAIIAERTKLAAELRSERDRAKAIAGKLTSLIS